MCSCRPPRVPLIVEHFHVFDNIIVASSSTDRAQDDAAQQTPDRKTASKRNKYRVHKIATRVCCPMGSVKSHWPKRAARGHITDYNAREQYCLNTCHKHKCVLFLCFQLVCIMHHAPSSTAWHSVCGLLFVRQALRRCRRNH